MITNTSPVAVFCFKRLNHLKNTITSLQANSLSKKTHVYFFSDAAKNAEDQEVVAQVREYLRTLTDFYEITIIEREHNLGLSKSIISGVSHVLNLHNSVIVIEDDLEVAPYFLSYMNDALALYEKDDKIAMIHGYTFPVKRSLPDTFFLKGADCWGWATWKRAWQTFEQDGRRLLADLKDQKLIKAFDLNGLVANSQMLRDQITEKNDSWAIRWHASCFLNNMLTLHPGKSLVRNVGFDGTGEHCNLDQTYATDLTLEPINLSLQPSIESELGLNIYKEFYKNNKTIFIKRLIRKIKSYANKGYFKK